MPLDATRLRQARRLFANDQTPRHTQRHNIRQWARALRLLGDKWLLARPTPAQHPRSQPCE